MSVIAFYHVKGTYGPFSNFYVGDDGAFLWRGRQFRCSEQAIMAAKAELFPGNDDVLSKIMDATEPAKMKSWGRKVRNFDDAQWVAVRRDVAISILFAKFAQNARLKRLLLGTGDAILAEASPSDRIWGVGVGESEAADQTRWRGTNLLGDALMAVRQLIRDGREPTDIR